ncbi:hypothetical protein [Caulobacter soli]|uniref:hypothetical protein n=1 Tax=Caulobacter soli TaxID=2708539 RepID=UPI0013EDF5BA|nr:hypothetical protein [Caulobacter soli]
MSALRHSARLSPFQPETVWTLEGAELVERRGPREQRFPLSALTSFRLAKPREGGRRRVLTLGFGGRRKLILTAQSYVGPGRFDDRLASFSLFARAVAAVASDLAPRARFEIVGVMAPREGLTWVMGFLAFGVVVMLLFAFSPGMLAISIEIAARMAFVLILLAAALPWLGRSQGLDPHALPEDLLPGG